MLEAPEAAVLMNFLRLSYGRVWSRLPVMPGALETTDQSMLQPEFGNPGAHRWHHAQANRGYPSDRGKQVRDGHQPPGDPGEDPEALDQRSPDHPGAIERKVDGQGLPKFVGRHGGRVKTQNGLHLVDVTVPRGSIRNP